MGKSQRQLIAVNDLAQAMISLNKIGALYWNSPCVGTMP